MDEKEYAMLDYLIMMQTEVPWASLSDFEKALADFFTAHGFEAEVMRTMEGQYCKRILCIKKKDDFLPGNVENTEVKPLVN